MGLMMNLLKVIGITDRKEKKINKIMININNNSYSGKNIVITNGKVFIDGMDVTPDSKNIDIKIEGNIDELKVDSCNSIYVLGSVKNINTLSGDVDVVGHVGGNLKTMSGNIKCGDVEGSISTMSGDITHRKMCTYT